MDTQGEAIGSLGIRHLHSFWLRKVSGAPAAADIAGKHWVADNTLLCGLRLGLRETYDHLLQKAPSFAEFEAWVVARNGGSIDAGRIARLNDALSDWGLIGEPADPDAAPVLTDADLEFWDANGYVVVRDAVPPANCPAAVEAICAFLDVDVDRPETWYGGPQGHSIWVPLLHHPALSANRESPRIHRAFAQLWDREDLWVNVDQTGFNPPEKPGWSFPGPHLHWDVSLAQPIPFGLQGILYLVDTPADQGAFTCVPGFHRAIEGWLAGLGEDEDPRRQDLSAGAVPIAGRAGDLVIWHHCLPHRSSPNRAKLPRIVQYLTLRPSTWGFNPEWR